MSSKIQYKRNTNTIFWYPLYPNQHLVGGGGRMSSKIQYKRNTNTNTN
jgi:hypothetical protein